MIEVLDGKCWSIKDRKFVSDVIPEGQVGRISPRAFCPYDASKPADPKYFRVILENSLSDEDITRFCTDFVKLLGHNQKQHKDKVPCLVGDANSGKTSLFFPLLGIIHHSHIATITKQRAFNNAMITQSTEIIFIDEATVSLLHVDDWKTLTQGGYTAVDVKYHDAKSFINKCPMIITAQKKLEFKKEGQAAMDRRLNTYQFSSLPNTKKTAAEWLKHNPMDCIIWASEKALPNDTNEDPAGFMDSERSGTEGLDDH